MISGTYLSNFCSLAIDDEIGSDPANAVIQFEGKLTLVGVQCDEFEVAGHTSALIHIVKTDDRR